MVNQTVEYVGDQNRLSELVERIRSVSVLALDIETINWWDRDAERIALVQLAYRESESHLGSKAALPIQVAIVDPLAGIDLTALKVPLELGLMPKVIHNASYDAVRLARHCGIRTSPIFDTMLAARRSGEKKCSLKAQVGAYLGIELDKAEQRSDWSRRPLTMLQLEYAALDASCTLLLYELQAVRGLRGDYELAKQIEKNLMSQAALPLGEESPRANVGPKMAKSPASGQIDSTDLGLESLALLGIVAELSGRYSPEQLAASVGGERIGLAGWIIDNVLGRDEDLDEAAAKQEIRSLCERGLIHISLSRRLEVAGSGAELWRLKKPNP